MSDADAHQTVRQALKSATAPAHARLDSLVANRLLRSPDRVAYRRLLVGLMALLERWERAATGVLDENLPGLVQQRSKLPMLRADLAILGGAEGDEIIGPKLPRMASVAEALGAMYVIEGSTLGGIVLSRRLASAGLPAAYFPAMARPFFPVGRSF